MCIYSVFQFHTHTHSSHTHTSHTHTRSQELQKFCRHIVSGFFATAEKNPLIFVELLFWKTSQDVYELTEGYGTLERERSDLTFFFLSLTYSIAQKNVKLLNCWHGGGAVLVRLKYAQGAVEIHVHRSRYHYGAVL